MPCYIADYDQDYYAEFSGTYTADEDNKVVTFGSDGQADTGFVLPSASEWLLIEVYEVDGTVSDIGFTSYHDNVSRIADYIARARTAALAAYTTFKITATHYKGDDTADVYTGDETTAVSIFNSDVSFTPEVTNWLIDATLTSPTNKLLICDQSYPCDTIWLC